MVGRLGRIEVKSRMSGTRTKEGSKIDYIDPGLSRQPVDDDQQSEPKTETGIA
jgi:hypothetical protein